MSQPPPAVRRYVAALTTAALAATALAVARMPAPDRDAVLLAGVLAVCLAAAWLFPLHFAYKTKLYVDTAVVFAAVLLLDPGLALPLAGLGTLAAHLLRPASRVPLQLAFNTAQEVLQVGAGSLVLVAAGWDCLAPAFDRPTSLLAVGASA